MARHVIEVDGIGSVHLIPVRGDVMHARHSTEGGEFFGGVCMADADGRVQVDASRLFFSPGLDPAVREAVDTHLADAMTLWVHSLEGTLVMAMAEVRWLEDRLHSFGEEDASVTHEFIHALAATRQEVQEELVAARERVDVANEALEEQHAHDHWDALTARH